MWRFLKTRQKIGLITIGMLLLLNFFAFKEVFVLAAPRYLQVHFLDVGQGDAIFIKTPRNHQILIDGGPDFSVLGKLQELMPFWDRNLDVVILTHPDSDHLDGLLYVLKKYKVDYIFWTGVVKEGEKYREWIELLTEAKEKGSKIIKAAAPQNIQSGAARMSIIYPFEDLSGIDFTGATNETSVIAKLVFGISSFLFTGDTISKAEKEVARNTAYLQSNVLKVAHHGSKSSTSEEMLAKVNPQAAVIEVGKNSYGHPHPSVLQRLQEFGIVTFRTDNDGDIRAMSDGENINIGPVK